MSLISRVAIAGLVVAVTGCGQAPIKPADTHLRAPDPRPEGVIPAPVQAAPILPKPEPVLRPETYSVVVHNVPVQELLFALARDAKLQIDVHPEVTGAVTLNAIDQTLPQLLARISRQVDMRHEINGNNLLIVRDTPYLRVYRVDYVNVSRDARSVANLSSQVSGGGAAGGAGGGGAGASNNSTSTINATSTNKFWETLVANVRDILRETDKVLPGSTQDAGAAPGAPAGGAAATPPPAAGAGASAGSATPGTGQGSTFREAASVIANPESGVLSIRATSRQHEKLQEFLDLVMVNARRQVLIEATIAEVQLNNQYQRGIDWTRVRRGASGISLTGSSAATPAAINTNALVISAAAASIGFQATIKLLESFGDVRVLSSPKLSVLNNQTAVLKVVDNLVYFTIRADTTTNQTSAVTTFSTSVNSVPVGFIMSVVPQISENDNVLLNLRPIISRKIGDVADPNPSLKTAGVSSLIPVIQTREMESVLRVQSGETAVMGGLMQDSVSNVEDGIPGLNQIPGLGDLFKQRKDVNQKTELVIFLRPTVVRDASVDGDFRAFRDLLPGPDYFTKPDPSRLAPPILPGGAAAQ